MFKESWDVKNKRFTKVLGRNYAIRGIWAKVQNLKIDGGWSERGIFQIFKGLLIHSKLVGSNGTSEKFRV